MAETDAIERLATSRDGEGRGGAEEGAILFDPALAGQAEPDWLDPGHWGRRAKPVGQGGRGGAWFVDAPFGRVVLRRYLRGGMAARLSRDRYLWQGERRVRSFVEYRLTRSLLERGLPVPRPLVAGYRREGASYRAAIMLERLDGARTFAACVSEDAAAAPWEAAGRLVARFHRAGLDHADLNADNLLFDPEGDGWLIDFDRGRLRKPGSTWRQNNLARLLRSLQKLRGQRSRREVEADFARLYDAYEAAYDAAAGHAP